MVLGYVGWALAKPHFTLSRRLGRQLAPVAGLGAGVLQGATGIPAPIGVTFIHSLRLHRTAHVFAVSAMFLLFAVVQIPRSPSPVAHLDGAPAEHPRRSAGPRHDAGRGMACRPPEPEGF